MLYDPKWEKPEVKSDPFSLESLIAWLETMPEDQTYAFHNCRGGCLYSQYLASHGFAKNPAVLEGEAFDFWLNSHSGPMRSIASMEPWTFGAALSRARKTLAA